MQPLVNVFQAGLRPEKLEGEVVGVIAFVCVTSVELPGRRRGSAGGGAGGPTETPSQWPSVAAQ